MALPLNTIVYEYEMDPYDIVDFDARMDGDTDPLLKVDEVITDFDILVGAEGTLLGVDVGTGDYVADLIDAGKAIRFWLMVDPVYLTNPAFSGVGTTISVEVSVTTNSDPARQYQRTLAVKVAQQ